MKNKRVANKPIVASERDGAERHTPTPWTLGGTIQNARDGMFYETKIISGGIVVARVNGVGENQSKANASFVECAVNAHEELLETLRYAKTVLKNVKQGLEAGRTQSDLGSTDALELIKSAIAKAAARR